MSASAVDARSALETLGAAAEDGRLDELCDRLEVRLLGAFGSAAKPAEQGIGVEHDLDIAVGFRSRPQELQLLDGLVRLTGYDRIDLVNIDGADPVLRAEAMVGVPLYQHAAGVCATEQMAALAERSGAEWLRRLDLRTLT